MSTQSLSKKLRNVETRTREDRQGQSRTNSTRSNRTVQSNSSVILSKKRAELEAAEKMATLEQKELEIKRNLLKKQLEVNIAAIDVENAEKHSTARTTSSRLQSWIIEQNHRQDEQPLNAALVPPRCDYSREPSREREPCRQHHIHATTSNNNEHSKNDDIKLLAKEIGNLRKPVDTKLPIFYGNIREWLAFKAGYEETKRRLSDTENIARLRRCLKGDAREAVSSLLFTQVQPDDIVSRLEQRFGRPEIILQEEIRSLKELPKLSDSSEQLSRFAAKVDNFVATIRALKKPEHFYNLDLLHALKMKMHHLKPRWLAYAEEHEMNLEPELVKLSEFLNKEITHNFKYWLTEPVRAYTPSEKNKSNYKTNKTFYTEDVDTEDDECIEECNANSGTADRVIEKACPYCSSNEHRSVHECNDFKKLTTDDRWQWAKSAKYCFKCLKSKHRREVCKKRPCGINGCKMSHNELLHATTKTIANTSEIVRNYDDPPDDASMSDKRTEVTNARDITTCGREMQCNRALLKMIRVKLTGPAGTAETFALLDGGSTLTLLDNELADNIGLIGYADPLVLGGINGTTHEPKSRRVNLKIIGTSKIEHDLYDVRTVQKLGLISQSVVDMEKYDHLRELPHEDICYENANVGILIGQDNWHVMISKETRTGRRNEPVASLTPLGWVVHGYHSSFTKAIHFVGHTDEEMNKMVEDYFRIDSLGVSIHKKDKEDDARAIDILLKTSRRIENGKRWEVGLLWKDDEPKLPESYNNASRRLKQIEREMDRNPDYGKKYVSNVNNFLQSGYAVPCDPIISPRKWYLAHFGVTNVNKPGKLRIVFDAASRTNGTSLNDKLLRGPDLLLSLLAVLFKFREGKVAISADIKEMFLQIRIRPEDRPAQRFLWRGMDRRGPVKEHEMKSVIFGAVSSPATAIFIKNRNADDFEEDFPEAVKAIKTRFYMDDYLHSVGSEEEALQLMKDVSFINKEGGFILTQWMSNSAVLVQAMDPDKRGTKSIDLNFDENVKTLGLRWNTQDDTLGFNLNFAKIPKEVLNCQKKPTKRQMLKVVMSVFDPLGLLTPIIIQGKILLQEVWRSGIDWDKELAEPETVLWNKWLQKLKASWSCRIPRCYNVDTTTCTKELHLFCDASEKAYAAVAYWIFIHPNGSRDIALIGSKARVTPLKLLSIPRLELQAALLGARLANTIIQDHDVLKPSRRYFWSDSSTVVAWIKRDPRNYKAYVAHRLCEIAELTKSSEWKWLPTHLNIADDATREISGLDVTHRWFVGPSFLHEPEELWPKQPENVTPANDTEMKKSTELVGVIDDDAVTNDILFCLPNIERLPKWLKLIRSTAYMFLFIERTQKKHDGGLDRHHFDKAEEIWTIQSQRQSFAAELKQIKTRHNIDKSNRLYKLNPFLDDRGIMRLHGRANRVAEVDTDVYYPIILDGKDKYTQILTKHYHEKFNHGNTETVVNFLRQRYWILKLRPTVKFTSRTCQSCRIRRALPHNPPTGDLPSARLMHHQRPFTHCGLDYFGPMSVTIGRRQEIRYGALFTCMTTRAVHLELAGNLTTDAVILALRRMMARRGCPKIIYSDNGTNFRGARTELQKAQKELNSETIKNFAMNAGVDWKFNPPAAAHMGGAWERLVQSTKRALRATLKEQAPHEDILLTLLIEAEHIINSRPLTHVSVDPEDLEALTPNHFLLGSSSSIPLPGAFDDRDLLRRKHWRRSQRLADMFWSRWIKEYLPTLLPRTAMGDNRPELKIGNIVVIIDDKLPRNVWPKGIIEKVFPGADGHVRVVDVRTAGGILKRPAVKIVRLPVHN